MATVLLGNKNAGERVKESEEYPDGWRKIPGKQITTISIPDGWSLADALRGITHPDGAWKAHSKDDAPAWVECDDETLAMVLASQFKCPIGRPKEWSK
jgi:hypothetical protein